MEYRVTLTIAHPAVADRATLAASLDAATDALVRYARCGAVAETVNDVLGCVDGPYCTAPGDGASGSRCAFEMCASSSLPAGAREFLPGGCT